MQYDEYNLGVMDLVERLEQQREHERQVEDERFTELTKEAVVKAQAIIDEYKGDDSDFPDHEACVMHSEKLKDASDVCVDRQYSTMAEPESNVVSIRDITGECHPSLEQEVTKIKKQFEIDEWKDNR